MLRKMGMMMLLIFLTLLHTTQILAQSTDAPKVLLDGDQLNFSIQPKIVSGTTLVPLRKLAEEQGATVSWEGSTRTVTVSKQDIVFTYIIGESIAHINDVPINLSIPGQLIEGVTLIPLRFISESLGNTVHWLETTRSISISTSLEYGTLVDWGVNLRSAPNTQPETSIYRMLSAGEKIYVIEEIDAFWLKVQTHEGNVGYISAKPKYTDYSSKTLHSKQMDKLITFGEQYLETPYEFGASTNQTETFDCSSFVKHLYEQVLNLELPRTSYNQAEQGTEVSKNELEIGDLMFFNARGLPIGHVGIYAGDNQILHTYSDTLGVHYAEFDGQWEERFVSARRIF